MYKIDAHVHFHGGQDGAALLERLGIKALNISVADVTESIDWRHESRNVYGKLAATYPDHFAWITSFDLPDYSEPDAVYADRVIAELEKDFANGAVACKAWKNIGMELKNRDGDYVMIDDPIFKPLFDYLERTGRSAVMHIGEPKACWLPLDPDSPHYGYYSEHPQWHMYGRTDMPSHEQLIAARDHVVERHPDLPVIGAHYGSLEYDMAEVAARFERYPNFAIDTSGRLGDAAYHDRETMRDFFTRYPDRILWGTDQGVNAHQRCIAPPDSRAAGGLALLAQLLEKGFVQPGGDRTGFAGADGVAVDVRDGGDACGGAGDHHFLGRAQLLDGEGGFVEGQAERSRQIDGDGTRDAVQNRGVGRVRPQRAVAHR